MSEMTIEIGSIRSVLEEEVRNRTKFENRRVLVPLLILNFISDSERIAKPVPPPVVNPF